jgi:putative aldouronate transport system substrate-binding protein
MRLKRFVASVLIASMAFSMVACSSGKKDTKDDTESKETVAATEKGDIDIWAPYDETVKISTVTSEYASAVYPEGDDCTNNVWTRAYKEKFNVDLVTDWVSDEYDTKLNLAIAESNLPDVFHVNASQLKQLIEADLIWDLSDVYDTYASDRIKGYMDADQETFESGKVDGKLYGIPMMHWGYIDQPDYIWIRKDWKDSLNLKDPETMDDVVNICKAFMKEHGGYGMAVDQTLDYLNLLAIAWGAHPDMWLKAEDGSIVYGSIQPEMKEALAAWQEWYKEGIICSDFATYDFNKMVEADVAGTVGVQPFYQWWGYNPGVDTVKNLGPEAIFEPYQIPSANGKEVLQSVFYANGSYTVVSKKCKHPEAALKLINYYGYMIDDSTGKEDKETISAFTDNDMAHVVGAFRVLNPNCDYDQYVQVSAALQSGDTSKLTTSGMWQKYNNSVEYKNNQTPAAVGDFLQQGNDRCAYKLAKDVLDNNKYIKSELWGVSPEQLLSYGTTLEDILTEGFTKIILGEESVDYFDTVVENWMAAGGEAVTAAMNEQYGSK